MLETQKNSFLLICGCDATEIATVNTIWNEKKYQKMISAKCWYIHTNEVSPSII